MMGLFSPATFHGITLFGSFSLASSAAKVCGVRRLLLSQLPSLLCRYPSPAPQMVLPKSSLRVTPSSLYGRTISVVYFSTWHGRG